MDHMPAAAHFVPPSKSGMREGHALIPYMDTSVTPVITYDMIGIGLLYEINVNVCAKVGRNQPSLGLLHRTTN